MYTIRNTAWYDAVQMPADCKQSARHLHCRLINNVTSFLPSHWHTRVLLAVSSTLFHNIRESFLAVSSTLSHRHTRVGVLHHLSQTHANSFSRCPPHSLTDTRESFSRCPPPSLHRHTRINSLCPSPSHLWHTRTASLFPYDLCQHARKCKTTPLPSHQHCKGALWALSLTIGTTHARALPLPCNS